MLVLAVQECMNVYASDTRWVSTVNERIDEVRSWLNARPLQDNPGWVAPPAAQQITWEEWVNRGKAITGVEESLLWMLANEHDPVARSAIVLALGFVGGDKSIDPIIDVLKIDNPLVQMEAAASLGRLGRSSAVEALCKALKNPDLNVRANVCMALGRLGGVRAHACLKEALQDTEPFVQAAAQEALRVVHQ